MEAPRTPGRVPPGGASRQTTSAASPFGPSDPDSPRMRASTLAYGQASRSNTAQHQFSPASARSSRSPATGVPSAILYTQPADGPSSDSDQRHAQSADHNPFLPQDGHVKPPDSAKDLSNKEASNKEVSNKEVSNKEFSTRLPSKGTTPARQSTPSKQTTPKQATPKQTTPKQATPKQTNPKQTTPSTPSQSRSNQTSADSSNPYSPAYNPNAYHAHTSNSAYDNGTYSMTPTYETHSTHSSSHSSSRSQSPASTSVYNMNTPRSGNHLGTKRTGFETRSDRNTSETITSEKSYEKSNEKSNEKLNEKPGNEKANEKTNIEKSNETSSNDKLRNEASNEKPSNEKSNDNLRNEKPSNDKPGDDKLAYAKSRTEKSNDHQTPLPRTPVLQQQHLQSQDQYSFPGGPGPLYAPSPNSSQGSTTPHRMSTPRNTSSNSTTRNSSPRNSTPHASQSTAQNTAVNTPVAALHSTPASSHSSVSHRSTSQGSSAHASANTSSSANTSALNSIPTPSASGAAAAMAASMSPRTPMRSLSQGHTTRQYSSSSHHRSDSTYRGATATTPASHARTASMGGQQTGVVPSTQPRRTPSQQSSSRTYKHETNVPGVNDHIDGHSSSSGRGSSRKPQKRTSIGPWDFIKSIGAGSMGQVKLASHRYTKQLAAVKIVPKAFTQRSKEGRESNEEKDARVIREAAIGRLLDHPNISRLYDVYSMTGHFYLVFEYINGGQMLDYIIAHGCVKETQARRFARSISSALAYCHHNSIVHRDLKIENILIADDGDVRLIDFGLSNLFRRDNLLRTFCGSLYFAAPELLNALPYVGPEIDVWSFGVVLYVLVCGKVPFEDKSMTVLHSKIKRGTVDYPQWLSSLCVDLLSRMLTVNPSERATMSEVMHHPWITKGFDTYPDAKLPRRVPLTINSLEPEVIDEMEALGIGDAKSIEKSLRTILNSAEYQQALDRWYDRQQIDLTGDDDDRFASLDSLGTRTLPPSSSSSSTSPSALHKHGRSTSSNQLLAPLPLMPSTPYATDPDPLDSFAPEISCYFLTKERLAKAKFGSATSSSSNIAVPFSTAPGTEAAALGIQLPSTGPSHPPGLTLPSSDGAPSFDAPANSSSTTTATMTTTNTAASMTASRASRVSGSTAESSKRKSASLSQPWKEPTTTGPAPTKDTEHKFSAPEPTIKVGRTRAKTLGSAYEGRPSPGLMLTPADADYQQQLQHQPDMPAPQPAYVSNITQRAQLGVVTSTSAAKPINLDEAIMRTTNYKNIDNNQRFVSQPQPKQTLQTNQQQLLPAGNQLTSQHSPAQANISLTASPSVSSASSQPMTSLLRKLSLRRKAAGHTRAKSTSHATAPDFETRSRISHHSDSSQTSQQAMPSIESPKPVFFRGIFSVQTTSTKPLRDIRAEIIRVLQKKQIEYVEVRGGFACVARSSPSHVLSISDIQGSLNSTSDVARRQQPRASSHSRHTSFGGNTSYGTGNTSSGTANTSYGTSYLDTSQLGDQLVPSSPQTPPRSSLRHRRMISDNGVASPVASVGGSAESLDMEIGASDMLGDSQQTSSVPVRFEIDIVRVPIVSLHGVQFKKMTGNVWSYKNIAQDILEELRL